MTLHLFLLRLCTRSRSMQSDGPAPHFSDMICTNQYWLFAHCILQCIVYTAHCKLYTAVHRTLLVTDDRALVTVSSYRVLAVFYCTLSSSLSEASDSMRSGATSI